MEPTIDIYKEELALLKEENIELKKQLKMSQFIKKKYDLLRNENDLFKQQVAVLNEENEALKQEMDDLRKKYKNKKSGGDDGMDNEDVHDTHNAEEYDNKIDVNLLNGDDLKPRQIKMSQSARKASDGTDDSDDSDDDEEDDNKDKEEEKPVIKQNDDT